MQGHGPPRRRGGGERRERKRERVRERGKMSGEQGKGDVKAKGKSWRRIPDGGLVCSRCGVTPSQVRVFGASGDAGARRDPPRAATASCTNKVDHVWKSARV